MNDLRFDDVERRVLEEHGGDERVAVLGQCGGDDGAERVADDDGGFADLLQEPVDVVDVVVEAVAAGGAVGSSVAAEVEGVAAPSRRGAGSMTGAQLGAVGRQAVEQDEGRPWSSPDDVVGDGGTVAGERMCCGPRLMSAPR